MKKVINWKIFLILLGLGLVSIACVFPYVANVQSDVLRTINQPLIVIFLAQLLQTAILFSICIFFGLYFAKKINFKTPVIEAFLEKRGPAAIINDIVPISALLGIVAAVAIYAVDVMFTHAGAGLSTHQDYAPAWQKLLAAVYGGTSEEILMRLFLMSLLVWLGTKIFRQAAPAKTTIIISIIIAAIIFGLGHLPITASLTAITPLIIVRAVVLNGIGGIIFGCLYWKKGLESAMIAHFTADVFLLTILPLLFK